MKTFVEVLNENGGFIKSSIEPIKSVINIKMLGMYYIPLFQFVDEDYRNPIKVDVLMLNGIISNLGYTDCAKIDFFTSRRGEINKTIIEMIKLEKPIYQLIECANNYGRRSLKLSDVYLFDPSEFESKKLA